MKKCLGIIPILLFLLSCQPEQQPRHEDLPFELAWHQEDAVRYGSLTLYPVLGTTEMIKENESISQIISLSEAIRQERFRITEKKPYGRFDDQDAVNKLTVQNKTEGVVLLMHGDVVQGGLQDRVLAENRIIPPRTITDIPVFCVEKGRWGYLIEEEEQSETTTTEQDKKILAFRGYYNVASSQVRKSMEGADGQEQVWSQVNAITSANEAISSTKAYAGLENSESFTQERNEYLSSFSGAFDHIPKAIGFVAVSGNEILGADIFGHPGLFRRQYEALLHSYITDAITHPQEGECSTERIKKYGEQLKKYFVQQGPNTRKLTHEGALVYFSDL